MKFPKNNDQRRWTAHIKNKMLFYRISEQKIQVIMKTPDRKEEGIALNTLAVMKRNDTPKRKEELWVMYAKIVNPESRIANPKRFTLHDPRSATIMISTWRYPGKSKPGKQIPIPDDILEEIKKDWF